MAHLDRGFSGNSLNTPQEKKGFVPEKNHGSILTRHSSCPIHGSVGKLILVQSKCWLCHHPLFGEGLGHIFPTLSPSGPVPTLVFPRGRWGEYGIESRQAQNQTKTVSLP